MLSTRFFILSFFLQDKALEVSMEFDAEAQAAPPQSQGEDGAGEKKKEDEAMDCEEGLVDLSEGGTIENKAKPDSAGDDDDSPEDENAAEQQGQREDIQVEGEKLRGEKELEAASEEADGERQSTPEDETQKHSKDAEAPEAQTVIPSSRRRRFLRCSGQVKRQKLQTKLRFRKKGRQRSFT